MNKRYKNFAEFYPDYLAEHRHPQCRRLHFIGSALVLVILSVALIVGKWEMLLALPVVGYGFAWAGHFFFERNKPATFKHPLYSLIGDWVMFKDMLTGKRSF